jgi:hypothetical protein
MNRSFCGWNSPSAFFAKSGQTGEGFQGCYNLCREVIAAQKTYLDIPYSYNEKKACLSLKLTFGATSVADLTSTRSRALSKHYVLKDIENGNS